MRPSLCNSCLASLLKLLIFLQTFVGVSILVYSAWILSYLKSHGDWDFDFNLDKLPAPWFVCALVGFGILVCLIAFIGHVAAEAISGCCLCFYAILTTTLILLEAALLGDVVFNKHWEEDLPPDSTGELKRLRAFIEDNMDIWQWVGITVIVVQVLSLLLAMILRSMVPRRTMDYDSDEDFFVIRRPLINAEGVPTHIPTTVDSNNHHSDFWSSRMRQKNGSQIGRTHRSIDEDVNVDTWFAGEGGLVGGINILDYGLNQI